MIVKFNDGIEMPNANISINKNLCTIITEMSPDTTGFKVYGDYNLILVDGSLFTTLYRVLEDGYQLSNDGSEYIPPVPPEPPAPHEFTHTSIALNDQEFDALDYADLSFYLINGVYNFDNIYELTVGDQVYTNIKLNSMNVEVIDDEPYIHVVFRELTDLEKQVNINTANIDYIAMESDIDL